MSSAELPPPQSGLARLPEALPVYAGHFELEWVKKQDRWQVLCIPGLTYPLPKHAVTELLVFLEALHAEWTADPAIGAETVLQFSQLHVEDRATMMSDRGRSWQPRMGLGVYPDQPAPETWTRKDFEVFPDKNAKMRPPVNNVIKVNSQPDIQQEIISECLVCGGVFRFYTPDFKAFTKEAHELLAPLLTSSVFQGFLFYVPLLNLASFRDATDEMLDTWLPHATAYIAQCPMEDCMVIAFRGDLQTIVREYHRSTGIELPAPGARPTLPAGF